jgi:hypothetical protein
MGMSAEKRMALAAYNAIQRDWYGRCRVCGEKLMGTIKELSEHKHGDQITERREPS